MEIHAWTVLFVERFRRATLKRNITPFLDEGKAV